MDDHPEFSWNVETIKSLLKNIDETDSAERKPGSGRLRSVLAADNIEDIGDMILNQDDQSDTHKTPTEIANEISRWNRIIDEDLQLCPLKKTKVENWVIEIEKRYYRSNGLLEMFTRKKSDTTSFSDENIFKVKQQYNMKNDAFLGLKRKKEH